MEKVNFLTSDQVNIVGDFYKADQSIGQTILALHMMPADKKSWAEFAKAANLAGYHVLAIDLRGHGESTDQNGVKLDYQNFGDDEHQKSLKDIEAAIAWLDEKGILKDKISLIGASIGANLALWYAQKHHEIYNVILLSPGLDYRGINTEKIIKGMGSSQSALLVCGDKDQYPHESVAQLKSLMPGGCETIVLPTAAHGTNLLAEHPKLTVRILGWLNEEVGL